MTRSLSVQQNTSEAGRSYRPGRIRERNREAILQAAEQEFALHGYKGTTIQNIAERAGLPKSNVLYYFSNKKLMYSAMFQGQALVAAINASKNKPEIFGLAIAPAAIVEGFSVFAFVFALVLAGSLPA